MKLWLFVILMIAAAAASGCRSRGAASSAPAGARSVLCTTFPIYLLTANVAAGSRLLAVELMIPPAKGCPHDYVLTPQDMEKLASADVLVTNGEGMEEFLGPALAKARTSLKVLDSSRGIADIIQIKPEAHADHPAEAGHHEHTGPNPHLFASPRMAAHIVRNIAAELSAIEPAEASLYAKNADAYARQLDSLADEFAAAGKTFKARKIVTEHAVFDYLARDAGLEVVAVVEEDPGQAPSAAEMLELVKLIKDSAAAAVFTEPQYPARVGQTIAKEAGVPVAVLDPVASGPADAGLDYYQKIMAENLETLRKTLGTR